MSDKNSRVLFKVKDLLRELTALKLELESTNARQREEGVEFLMKKGFSRERAHYVSHLVSYMSQLTHLKKLTTDKRLKETIGDFVAYISDEVEIMYADQHIEKEDHHVR